MANSDWVERRQRMVKCKAHGLHYDPEMSTGCTLCLKEAAKAIPKRPPQLVLILLCLLFMTLILFQIFGPDSQIPAPPDLGIAVAPDPANKLDPELYRQPLEAFENVLFRTPIEESQDLLIISADIAQEASDLSNAILSSAPSQGLETADTIARLGQAMPRDQVTLNDILLTRSQWLRIRRQHLLPAAWLYEPSGSQPTEATLSIADYSAVAGDLRALIEDASLEAQAAGADDGAWGQAMSDFQSRLEDLRQRMPRRPDSRADGRLLAAIQELERAISQTRALISDSGIPGSSSAERRFDDAFATALRAQQALDAL